MKNKAIIGRDLDFAQWYTDVVRGARLAAYSNVKGCIIMEPNGYAIWEEVQNKLGGILKATGHQNVAMPLLIPENLMNKEKELVKGFAPEVAWVTIGGQTELKERLCIRPTSETLFSDYYSQAVQTHKDLPLKYNQWCSVMRWEKETRPFLRSREFFWQEGHTVHASAAEAEKETYDIIHIYKSFFEDVLAIPVLWGRKTESEKFAGAEYTLTIEALMYNGVSLQSGTSHYFGQRFSEAYNIRFLNINHEMEYAYQTSWGMSNRVIGAIIMVHGDDNGLVLPPYIAPIKAVIVGIGDDKAVENKMVEINNLLNDAGITCYIDRAEKSAGYKFAQSEVNGIPLRIEIGLRDLKKNKITISRRDTREKIQVDKDIDLIAYIKNLQKDIHQNLYQKAKARMEQLTFTAENMSDVEKIMNKQAGFIKGDWCGKYECEDAMKTIGGLKSRCILENTSPITGKCVACGAEAKYAVVWGIQY
ncbi:MAG: proline--tRNA ligase [Bacilli bacterium]|nr:proline--tRNA ligase [Bacilli bacterium]